VNTADTTRNEKAGTDLAYAKGVNELSVDSVPKGYIRLVANFVIFVLTRPWALFRAMLAERKEKPFTTSVEVVLMRALGVRDPSVRGTDVLAHHFLPPRFQLAVPLGAFAARVCERMAPGCYGFHNARTKHFDAVIGAEAAQGMEQLVLLGAGNDSRPYRMLGALQKARVFELDLPNTQQRKIRLVRDLYGRMPEHVTYIPIDFEKEAFERKLLEAGFDPKRKTLFSWEGVSYYLTDEAAKGVLRTMHQLSIPGGSIIFDYSLRAYNQGRLETYGGPQLREWLAKRGMAYHFGSDPIQMSALVAELGFDLISDIGAEELEKMLRVKEGGTEWRVWSNFRIVHARVC
jgi:methyltransferase (TIGR00027 family)